MEGITYSLYKPVTEREHKPMATDVLEFAEARIDENCPLCRIHLAPCTSVSAHTLDAFKKLGVEVIESESRLLDTSEINVV